MATSDLRKGISETCFPQLAMDAIAIADGQLEYKGIFNLIKKKRNANYKIKRSIFFSVIW